MLSIIGYGNSQIIVRGKTQTQELCCDVGKMILTFEDDTQIEVKYDDISRVWKITVLNKGAASQVLYNCNSKDALFSSDIFSIESKLQGIRHIKQKDGVI